MLGISLLTWWGIWRDGIILRLEDDRVQPKREATKDGMSPITRKDSFNWLTPDVSCQGAVNLEQCTVAQMEEMYVEVTLMNDGTCLGTDMQTIALNSKGEFLTSGFFYISFENWRSFHPEFLKRRTRTIRSAFSGPCCRLGLVISRCRKTLSTPHHCPVQEPKLHFCLVTDSDFQALTHWTSRHFHKAPVRIPPLRSLRHCGLTTTMAHNFSATVSSRSWKRTRQCEKQSYWYQFECQRWRGMWWQVAFFVLKS